MDITFYNLVIISLIIVILFNWTDIKVWTLDKTSNIRDTIINSVQRLKNNKQPDLEEKFSLLNNYFVKPPDTYKMTSIESGALAKMGVYAAGTFYEVFADYFRHKIFPVDLINTHGSKEIIRQITNDEIQLGICQEDLLYSLILGEEDDEDNNDIKANQDNKTNDYSNLRFMCSLYYESFVLVTHQYTGIYKWQDLKGKRLGFPEKDSGSFYNGVKLARIAGLEPGVDFVYYNTLSMNRLANMFINRDVDAIFLTTNQKNPYLINIANQRKVRFIGTKGLKEELLKTIFPFGFRKYINTSNYYANINSSNFLETYATRAMLVTNSDLSDKATYKIVKTLFEKSEELKNVIIQYLYHRKLDNYVPDAFDPEEMFYVNKLMEIHPGAKKYYEEIGLISYNPNPKCVKYASKGVCPLPSNYG